MTDRNRQLEKVKRQMGERLRALIGEDRSYAEVSRLTGNVVSSEKVRNVVLGKNLPSLYETFHLSKALNFRLEDILPDNMREQYNKIFGG